MILLLQRGRSVESRVTRHDMDIALSRGPLGFARHRRHLAPWRPPVDVFETDGELVVRAELGGLAGAEVEVLVSRDELVIRGERTIVKPSGIRRYHESRVQYGPFEAVVHMAFPVAVESATAEYIDGFLSVTLPRLAASKVASRVDGQIVEALQGDQ
jgi:HSP20 family molecular chaperone IbpA